MDNATSLQKRPLRQAKQKHWGYTGVDRGYIGDIQGLYKGYIGVI